MLHRHHDQQHLRPRQQQPRSRQQQQHQQQLLLLLQPQPQPRSLHVAAFSNNVVVHGTNGFVEYIPGDLPIIVVSPHGGSLRPADFPPLAQPHGKDSWSQEYARGLADELQLRTGRRPHLVVSHVHASLFNPARSQDTATGGHAAAGHAWEEVCARPSAACATMPSSM